MTLKTTVRRALRPAINALRDLRLTALLLADPIGKALAKQPQAPGRRILILDEMLPDPRFGAGYPRAARMLQAIVDEGWAATVYPLVASPSQTALVRPLFPAGVCFLPSHGRLGLRQLLQRSVGRFDAVLVSRTSVMAEFAAACARVPRFLPSTDCIYDAEGILSLREAQRLALFEPGSPPSVREGLLSDELALVAGAQAVIAVSDAEAAVFRARTGVRDVHVISHGVEIRADSKPLAGRADLLIVGRFTGPREQSPNVDSLTWFVDEVMPRLDRLLGADYRLVVVGHAEAGLAGRLASARVVFRGVVDDLAGVYDGCRVFIAPTRFAAGIPLKVIEAAASGIPCVVTATLARQLDFHGGTQALVADSADDFAAACARLYSEPQLWQAVRDAALASMAARHSAAVFAAAVRTMLAGIKRRTAGPPIEPAATG